MGLPITPLLSVKNSPGQLATIKIYALMGLDEVFRKNRTLLLYISRPPDNSSITAQFLFPKTMVFHPFYRISFPFFS
jgi:hypothetical protein